MEKKYLVGLDVGTDSVGWCVTDEDYNIVKKNGKSLWGSRLFDESKDASERRQFRASRRRIMRRKERINLLREIFADDIYKIDPNFYIRLDESKYYLEDKCSEAKFKQYLFINKDEIDYYKKFPTIYHLRKHLLEMDQKEDIRLIYLAIHHMIKYRGNFLKPGAKIQAGDISSIEDNLKQINNCLVNLEKPTFINNAKSFAAELSKCFKENSGTKYMSKQLKVAIDVNDDFAKPFITCLSGGKTKESEFFESDNDSDESFYLVDGDFDLKLATFEGKYDQNHVTILRCIKSIYDALTLNKIMGSSQYISDAMVERFNVHKRQLKELKLYVKSIEQKENIKLYDEIFRKYEKGINNYSKYIGSNDVESGEHCTADEFYIYLKKKLNLEERSKKGDLEAKKIFDLINDGEYLLRQNSNNNGIFPYQLNEEELKVIIAKQGKYYPCLNDSYKGKNKILSLLTFKIPYYIGPLTPNSLRKNDGKENSWVVRGDEKIYPWNFDEVVDKAQSAVNFIERMKNNCSYLHDKSCLSKGSIYYGYYTVLQDLNNIKLNSSKVSQIEKEDLIENLYLTKDKVTKKDIVSYYKNSKNILVTVSTINSSKEENFELNGNLKSLRDFIAIEHLKLGEKASQKQCLNEIRKNIDKIESIINEVTVFEDKSILKSRLCSVYKITDQRIINKIMSLAYKGYCSFSKELLLLHGIDKNGVVDYDGKTILDQMLETNANLMEIVSMESYKTAIALNNKYEKALNLNDNDSLNEYIENQYITPGAKRGLLQAVKIILEIQKIVGKDNIVKYCIETTRKHDLSKKGKLVNSRKKSLNEMYKNALELSKKTNEYKEDIKYVEQELNSKDYDEALQGKKLFLYFQQLGFDLYSGEKIDIDTLSTDYDIDHIIPQSKIKDDSLNNTVLTLKTINNEKKRDLYPIPSGVITEKGYCLIKFLHHLKNGYMSDEKYNRLMRSVSNPLSPDELKEFANRQLIFTSQSIKALCDLLTYTYKDEEKRPIIIYCKADEENEFRRNYDIVKSRLANNFHHAHDAYLNIFVGNGLYSYFNRLYNFAEKDKHYSGNMMTIFDPKKVLEQNVVYRSIVGKIISSKELINKIKYNVENQFDIMVTKRTYKASDGLFAQNIVSKAKNKIPIKGNDERLLKTEKYGGYDKATCIAYQLITDDKPRIIPFINGDKEIGILLNKGTIIKRGKCKFAIDCVTGGSFGISKGFECHFKSNLYRTIYKIEKIYNLMKANKLSSSIKTVNDNKKDSKAYVELVAAMNNLTSVMVNDNIIDISKGSKNENLKLSNDEINSFFVSLFDFVEKNKELYTVLASCLAPFTKDNLTCCINSPILSKVILAINFLALLTRNRTTLDGTIIGIGKAVGNTTFGGKFKKGDSIIFESITGYYTKSILIG